MSGSILSDFFYGNLDPSAKQFDNNSEFGKTSVRLVVEEDKLKAMIDGNASEMLDKVLQMHSDITSMTAEGYFIEGFRTGMRIAAAVFNGGEKPFLKDYFDKA